MIQNFLCRLQIWLAGISWVYVFLHFPVLGISYAARIERPNYLCNTSLVYAVSVSIAVTIMAVFMHGQYLIDRERITKIRRR